MNKGYTQDRSVKQKREEHMKELEWPKPMLTPSSKRNQSKYCHFHKDQGHDTEECLPLKEEIERLLRQGLLAKYVKIDRGKQRLEDRSPPGAGVINMIIREKARFKQSITFDEEDLISITHLHDDALVIVGDIADFDMKRVLVDGGNGDYPSTRLWRSSSDTGRNCGASSYARHIPATVVVVTNFLVVKTSMAYNAIYGRPLLNAAGAVPSTYH
ncbi:uncharacterized protein LOC111400631 [Olea europaea var. sylvestris]|uniref:uncharacterized protein LOC111400631 n=1 Tax=Olea europaea var. sylvestris TaxID=158386 RepID=UPI000C1CDB42|nr:uncharacterized protein LOC111400631 [Olea europaea var. sylvestris]